MSEARSDEVMPVPVRRGRPPKTPVAMAEAANEAFAEAAQAFQAPTQPMAHIVVSVKPSEGWKCPYVEDGRGGTRITTPKEQLWVPLSLAEHLEKHELAIILERKA